jgi:hypothetical protein
VAPIADAKHDVFLSLPGPRRQVYAELDRWLDRYLADTGTDSRATLNPSDESAGHG